MDAEVVAAGDAELAVAAGEGGLQADAVAGFPACDACADFDDIADGLVAEDLRVGGGFGMDTALAPPMEVGAAQTNGPHPDEKFAGTRAVGHG
jgi:hypothetical protein